MEKRLTETKKEMWEIRWHHKDTEKGCFFGSYLKTTGAITMKFGYILEKKNAESIYDVKKKCILSSFRANLHKLHNYEYFLSSKLKIQSKF